MKKLGKRGKIGVIGGAVLVGIILTALVMGPVKVAEVYEQMGIRVYKYLGYEFAPQHVRQLVTEDMSRSRVIMWDTKDLVEDPVVELKRVSGENEQIIQVDAVSERFVEGESVRYLYKATLNNLVPNTEYVFRVGSGLYLSSWYKLKTGDDKSVKAIIFPDSSSQTYIKWRDLAQGAFARNPDAAFFANLGNLVNNGASIAEWTSWLNGAGSLLHNVPFAPLDGSVGILDTDWHKQPQEVFNHLFSWPHQGNGIMRAPFYSFDYGDVHFVVIDTQLEEMPGNVRELAKQRQLAWLKEDLQQTLKKWKVVLMYRDSLSYVNQAGDTLNGSFSETGKIFMPYFDEGKVDLVLSGQLQVYRRRGHIEGFERSQKGPFYIVAGKAGDMNVSENWGPHVFDEYSLPANSEQNYLVLNQSGNELRISAYFMNGEKFDQIVLAK